MHDWGFGFWPLFPLFWLGIIIFLCWGARRWSGGRNNIQPYRTPGERPFEPNAMEILRRRYARGEIDGTTFDQMRERLESSGRSRD
jgi:putative membrane protein